jgi:hypothetical protein
MRTTSVIMVVMEALRTSETLVYSIDLTMEAVRTSETSVY